MKSKQILPFAFAIVLAFGHQPALAQITINIPRIPKIKKEAKQTEQPKTSGDVTVLEPPAPKQADEPYVQTDGRILLFRDELAETRKQIEEFTPETKISLVSDANYDWLLRAISPRERKEFFDKWQSLMSPKDKTLFATQMDAISAAASKKIPLFLANPKAFNFRNPAEEKMIKAEMSDIPGIMIHKIGLNQPSWLIDKNEWGLPTSRYKHGMIWGRDPNSDHPYCRFWYVNIIQDYAGGGTYGASYAKYTGTELAGCPAGK